MAQIKFGCKDGTYAYSDDDGKTWRWNTNNRPCPLHACKDYGIPCDPEAQQAAIDTHMDAFIAEYRATQPAVPSLEEQHEMRAAFGPGKEIVDVITGRRFTT
jgi:hypothetical protein